MNILFITLMDIKSVDTHGIYTDLIREFVRHGHTLYVVSPAERQSLGKTQLIDNDKKSYLNNVHILKIRTGNIQKTNFIEKGISTLLLEGQLKKGIKEYFSNIKFDLILYATPPVTIVNPIKYIKKRDHAKTYLMLKDITPQAIVDLGVMKKKGIMGFIYRYFRNKEKKLYEISDYIGCMSKANVDYIIKNNPQIDTSKVEVCPNSIEVIESENIETDKKKIRRQYQIPLDKRVFIYGGNLGKPQGIPFLIECLKEQKDNNKDFFLIIGDGTEFERLRVAINDLKQNNVALMKHLPKEDYDKVVRACDVGMVFLNYKFTVPNFPSRILSYMQEKLPIIACTDMASDVGKIITKENFGWWCASNSVKDFERIINEITDQDIIEKGINGNRYLKENYSIDKTYQIINNHIKE